MVKLKTAAVLLAAQTVIDSGNFEIEPSGEYLFDVAPDEVQHSVVRLLIKCERLWRSGSYPIRAWMDNVGIDDEEKARKWLSNDEFVTDWMSTLLAVVQYPLHEALADLVPRLMTLIVNSSIVDGAIDCAQLEG